MKFYEVPGLAGLELWRGISRGMTLFQLRESESCYFQGLRDFLFRLHHGEAAAADESETEGLRQAAGFTRVVLCGGDTLDPSLASVFSAEPLPFAVEIDDSGPYAAKKGALRIFHSMGWRRGIALDLGQSQLKVMTAGGNWSIARDTSLLPFGAYAIDASLGRTRLRNFIERGLSQASEESADGIVLGLPVALDGDGVAHPATYPGLFGPVEQLFGDLFPCPGVVLNDAVLAGVGFPPRGKEKTLIVTLGHGVGGALWVK